MRSIDVIIRRIRTDLPVTDEELDAANEWLKQIKKSNDRFDNIMFIGSWIAIITVIILWIIL